MVHTVRAFVLAFLIVETTSFAGLDLTPTPGSKELDGAKIPVLSFQVDGRTATYQPPHGWGYAGSSASLRIYCSGDQSADATVEKIPLPKPVLFDEAQMKVAAETAMQAIPTGSEHSMLVSQEKNPLKIGDKETIETVISYTFYGHAMQMSLLDLNMGTMLVRFKLIAEKKDFSAMHGLFRGSLFSWNGL